MKLNEFIANVLNDINQGINTAYSSNGKKYYIKIGNDGGVSFDIAVTTSTTKGSQAEGTAKAGFVEVLGAGVSGKLEDKKENSQVSRIKFVVSVPFQTEREEQNSITRMRQNENDFGI